MIHRLCLQGLRFMDVELFEELAKLIYEGFLPGQQHHGALQNKFVDSKYPTFDASPTVQRSRPNDEQCSDVDKISSFFIRVFFIMI